jgi:hypothetical protein
MGPWAKVQQRQFRRLDEVAEFAEERRGLRAVDDAMIERTNGEPHRLIVASGRRTDSCLAQVGALPRLVTCASASRATVEARRPLPSDQPSEEAAAGGVTFASWYDNSYHEAAWAAVLEIGTTRRWLETRVVSAAQIPRLNCSTRPDKRVQNDCTAGYYSANLRHSEEIH